MTSCAERNQVETEGMQVVWFKCQEWMNFPDWYFANGDGKVKGKVNRRGDSVRGALGSTVAAFFSFPSSRRSCGVIACCPAFED